MARQPSKDVNELVKHLKSLTDELTSVHSDLYWLAMQSQEISVEKPSLVEVNVELLAALKSAVDSMRLILWDYIEAASVMDPQKGAEGLETMRLKRVTQFLELLRKRLGRGPQNAPVSFIERISAAMKDRFRDRDKVA
ncbi:MAG TPA: hypothetical protein VKW06_12860 [Candidatus Angelobacter sp.]|nr:hypothetical protein [Candidatus Angelobacter sp.]